jgi:hypothetical protein
MLRLLEEWTEKEHIMDLKQQRQQIHESISDTVNEVDQSVVTGWVLVFEGMDENGDRSIQTLSSDATGYHELPEWTARGWIDWAAEDLAAPVLFRDPDPEEDDDGFSG